MKLKYVFSDFFYLFAMVCFNLAFYYEGSTWIHYVALNILFITLMLDIGRFQYKLKEALE